MSLTPQELRCVDVAAHYLATVTNARWNRDTAVALDDQYPNEPSPDALLRSDSASAAVEVKRLTGDTEWNTYKEARRSLQRSLAPSSGGHWMLSPSIDLRLPIDLALRRSLRRQIENAASRNLRPGEKTVIRIPRQANISLTRTDGPGHVWCCHTSTGFDELRRASALVGVGMYFLVDCGQGEHAFVTSEAKEAFASAVAEACAKRASGEAPVIVEWAEEWELFRGDDGPGDVEVITVTNARSVDATNEEAVDLVLGDALAKFAHRQWADFHVVVLESQFVALQPDRLLAAVQRYPAAVFEGIDLILIVDGDEAAPAWRSHRLS